MSRTPRVLCVRIGCIPSFCIAKVFIISVTTTISHAGWFCDCNTMFSDCSSCLIQLCIEDVGGVSSNKNLHFVLRVKALLATCLWPMPVLGIKIHGLAMRGLRLWNLACSRGGKPTTFYNCLVSKVGHDSQIATWQHVWSQIVDGVLMGAAVLTWNL